MIRFGRALLPAGDPDEPAMVLLNQVLGGMFSSRLNLKLREEKQWTYGAFSSIDTRLGAGPFVVGADVQTPNTIDAVAEILAQIDALKTGGPSAEELALARTSYVKTLPGLFALPPQQVGVASELFALGLPLDHHAALVAAVGAATPEAVKAAGERALVKEDFVVVLVGDRATIEAGLKDKDLGAVTFLNKDLTPAK
jgi:zinc protease